MKNSKKYFALLLVIVMVMGTTANATTSGTGSNATGPKGALTIEEEKALGIVETSQEAARRTQKESSVETQRIAASRANVSSTNSVSVFATLSVPAYQQETYYYCGPANTKQVIQYNNGSSLTQDEYATALGTTTAGSSSIYIAQVVADATSKNYIRSADIASLTTDQYINRINYGMTYDMPAIINVEKTGTVGSAPSNFPYTTGGHFMTTSGLDTVYDDEIRLTDTNGQWTGATWYSISVVKGINDAGGTIVW